MTKTKYTVQILPKAQQLHKTKMVKSMGICLGSDDWNMLKVENLICIILYTDHTELSTHFASTFRKMNQFETIDQIKRRHRDYYWLSRILRQTVREFGGDRHRGVKMQKHVHKMQKITCLVTVVTLHIL